MKSQAFPAFCLLTLSLLVPSGPGRAQPQEMLRRIESRRGTWIGLKAEVGLEFKTPNGKAAACRATLAYHRLDEKILLPCFDDKGKAVFVFKTTDARFELYLPARKTVFRGSIFDLEDSPEIESHLRAQDLYRALKPFTVQERDAEAGGTENGLASIKVFRRTPQGKMLSRKMRVTAEGDIAMEIYYHPVSGKPAVAIHREDFRRLGTNVFPFRIGIKANKEAAGKKGIAETLLVFETLAFHADLTEQDFTYELPEGTETVDLEATA